MSWWGDVKEWFDVSPSNHEGFGGFVAGFGRAFGTGDDDYSKPEKSEFNAPWQQAITANLTPTVQNPLYTGYLRNTGKVLDMARVNPAARASYLQRAKGMGMNRLTSVAPQAYGRYEALATALQRARDSLPDTTTESGAFWRGFMSGGGTEGAGALLAKAGG